MSHLRVEVSIYIVAPVYKPTDIIVSPVFSRLLFHACSLQASFCRYSRQARGLGDSGEGAFRHSNMGFSSNEGWFWWVPKMMDAACCGVPGPLCMNMRTCYPYTGVELGRYCLETMDLQHGPLTAAPLYGSFPK